MIPAVLLSTVVVSSNHVLSCACPQNEHQPCNFYTTKTIGRDQPGESITIFSKSYGAFDPANEPPRAPGTQSFMIFFAISLAPPARAGVACLAVQN